MSETIEAEPYDYLQSVRLRVKTKFSPKSFFIFLGVRHFVTKLLKMPMETIFTQILLLSIFYKFRKIPKKIAYEFPKRKKMVKRQTNISYCSDNPMIMCHINFPDFLLNYLL